MNLSRALLLALLLLKNQVCAAFAEAPRSSNSLLSHHQKPTFIAGAHANSNKATTQTDASSFVKEHPRRSNIAQSPAAASTHANRVSALRATANGATSTSSSSSGVQKDAKFKHVLAILTMPYTSMDRIANEAVLNEALQHTTNKLSIVLKCEGGKAPSLASLRRYVGEVYSQLWDFSMASEEALSFNDVVVYPQNLPNAAAEQWIHHLKDLDAICSHDSICGWVSEGAQGRGTQFQFLEGMGSGGLDTHVSAVNADRKGRNLKPVKALHVVDWPTGASLENLIEERVLFVDDDIPFDSSSLCSVDGNYFDDSVVDDEEDSSSNLLLGGARIPDNSLYNCVACGGTFDGMHYGHRKLLTLAVSSVVPVTGKLMVGVTVDDMLKTKQFAEYIPSCKERMQGVRDFLHRLAPGMKNRIIIEPISDAYGPPGSVAEGKKYDALVLSHETLANGVKLNHHRKETLGYDPLTLLCTRRTEAYGMSSTTLRRLRSMKQVEKSSLDRVQGMK